LSALSKKLASLLIGLAAVTYFSNIQMEERPPSPFTGETLGPGLLRAILRDADMSVDELIGLL
jgi:hypothetical protein